MTKTGFSDVKVTPRNQTVYANPPFSKLRAILKKKARTYTKNPKTGAAASRGTMRRAR